MIYTENYQLRKPVIGVDNADVNDLNYNSDRIDAIMHSSQISLADAYDLNSTYNTGDVVMYEFLMYRCLEDNVTGVWDPEKWIRTTAGEESGGGADLDIYGEASGTAEASFSDGAEASLVECEIGIVPTQDLHGYSKPWAGGAGKNKYIGSPSFDGYMNKSYWSLDSEEYNTHEVYKRNLSWSGMYKEIPLALGTYTFSIMAKADSSSSCALFLTNNDTTATVTNGTSFVTIGTEWGVVGVTFEVTTAGTVAPRIERTDANGYLYISEYQLEIGSQATTFEPYSNICPISGHTDVTITVASTSGGSGEDTTVSLGRTVYGGTLDVTTGELTVTDEVVDLGSLTWEYGTSSGVTFFRTNGLTNIKPTPIGSAAKAMCSIFPITTTTGIIYVPDMSLMVWSNGEVYIRDTDYTNAQSFKTAMSGQQLVYELATPQTFNLTPTQVKTLLGQNYVSHDGGGTISLVYIKKDSTIIPNPSNAEVPLTGLEISGKDFVITDARIPAPPTTNGAYVLTVTVSGGTPTYSWENA